MNIKQAKEQIANAMQAYFTKGEYGGFAIPQQRQRPVFLLGAPGIGKTAIMEQIASELDVGFISYSMTHHTRQSALGLPFIATRTYDGVEQRVSEYTMSEIIAAVNDLIAATGKDEGILFLDEINCVSETLTPAILQFLQYKTFGRHRLPEGWIVVTAGNPPEYNRSTHDFDIATWDRLKRIDVEPDFEVWREYACDTGVHPAVIAYLQAKPDDFCVVESTVDGKAFVTARGWDDLSQMMKIYERIDLPIDEDLIAQYLQHDRIAKRFATYYELFRTYRSEYRIDAILSGDADDELVQRAKDAGFDERVALVGLIMDALGCRLENAVKRQTVVERIHAAMEQVRDDSTASHGQDDIRPQCRKAVDDFDGEVQRRTAAGALMPGDRDIVMQARAFFAQMESSAAPVSLDEARSRFAACVDELDDLAASVSGALGASFTFCEDAFDEGQEMLLLVTDLAANRAGMAFINEQGCPQFFVHSKKLLFNERGRDILGRMDDLGLLDADGRPTDAAHLDIAGQDADEFGAEDGSAGE